MDFIDEDSDAELDQIETMEIINEYEQDRNAEIAKRVRGKWVIHAGTVEQLVNRLAGANPIGNFL